MVFRIVNTIARSRVLKGKDTYSPLPEESGRGRFTSNPGNNAAATAVIQVQPDVITFFPITPATSVLHDLAAAKAKGALRSEFINAASEMDAMSSCIGASLAGSRVFTATASVGFTHMYEMVHSAIGLRAPMVVSIVNRCLGGPLNIWADHGDIYTIRDAGIILMAENHQQIYDNMLQAFRMAQAAQMPVFTCHDGFFLSHALRKFRMLSDADAKEFVGEYKPVTDLLTQKISIGGLCSPEKYPLVRARMIEEQQEVLGQITRIGTEYEKYSERPQPLLHTYRIEDAEIALLNMGSYSGTIRTVVDYLRANGVPAGLINLRVYRPFPADKLTFTLNSKATKLKALGIIDNVLNPTIPPLYQDTLSALFEKGAGSSAFKIVSFRYGGGYNPTLADTNGVFQVLKKEADQKEPLSNRHRYINLYNEEPYELRLDGPELKKIKDKTSNILILGRGGQGGVTTGTMMARIANGFGKNAGAISAFGSEKTGSPTFTRVTISEEMIHDNSDRGYTPEYLIVLSPSVITELGKDVNEEVAEDGIIVVNTPKTPAEIREEFGIKGRKVVTIAASALSKEILGMDLPNVATLAALVFNASEILPEHEFMRAMDRELSLAFGAGSTKVELNKRMLRLVKEKMQAEKEEEK
ncbi:MAG: 2-oxoacid:acceptor oxidoreductase family protein [Candidatus Margulisiibacteriota bacterium]